MTSTRLSHIASLLALCSACDVESGPATDPKTSDAFDPSETGEREDASPSAHPAPRAFRQTASPMGLVDCEAVDLDPTGPSLVFHEPALLGAFGLGRTLAQIVETTPGGGAGASSISLLEDLTDSYDATERFQPAAALAMPVDQRPGERDMDENAMLTDVTPVALFNRFDLAPADGADCGEYRIVYAKTGPNLGEGRFTMIFEARYPNPTPELGREGCRPVADFWASLSDPALTDGDRVSLLEAFYYDGIVHEGVSLPPVVDFAHYAPGLGQIRTNNFINNVNWQLREFRTNDAGGQTRLVVDTVKDQPLAELFDANFSPGAPFDPAVFDALRADFRADFVQQQVGLLARPEVLGLNSALDTVNGFGAGFEERFFEFQGTAQDPTDDPSARADGLLRADIDAELGTMGLSDSLDAQVILDRAGTLTCGGCHFFSNDRVVGAGGDGLLGTSDDIRWPSDLGFVHVDEFGNLSEALTTSFLPARQLILEDFVCSEPAEAGGFEMGEATIARTNGAEASWTTVSFAQPFDTVPAVFIGANSRGSQPCHTRVRNVDPTGFQVKCAEPANLDGPHAEMTVGYVAAEEGSFTSGGSAWEVACLDVDAFRHGIAGGPEQSWQNVSFGTTFGSSPMVLAQLQADGNDALGAPATASISTWTTAAVHQVGTTGFQTAIDLAEVTPPQTPSGELMCYLAMEQSAFTTSSGARCEATVADGFVGWDNACNTTPFQQQFTSAPIAVGSMMSRNGGNGGWARECSRTPDSIGYRIDEDQFRDTERNHVQEQVGFFACESPVSSL